MIKPWIPKLLRGFTSFIFEKIENYSVKKFDVLLVPQPTMLNKYLNKNKNTILIENFVIVKKEETNLNKDYNNRNCFHAGRFTKDRGLLNMMNIYSLLDDRNQLFLAGIL